MTVNALPHNEQSQIGSRATWNYFESLSSRTVRLILQKSPGVSYCFLKKMKFKAQQTYATFPLYFLYELVMSCSFFIMFYLVSFNCRATQNSTHVLISTTLNACGTLVNETEDALIFWNEIQVDAVIVDNVITRTHDINLRFHCSYSRKRILSIQFQPQQIFIGSEGAFSLSFNYIATQVLYIADQL